MLKKAKNRPRRPKRFKQPFNYRLIATLGYTTPFLEYCVLPEGIYFFQSYPGIYNQISKLFQGDDFISRAMLNYIMSYKTYYTRERTNLQPHYLPLITGYLFHRIFLRRINPIIRLPYYIKHHFSHAVSIPVLWQIIDHILVIIYNPKRQSEIRVFYKYFFILKCVSLLPLIISAFRGLYLEYGFISENTKLHLGPFPPEELEPVEEDEK